MTKTGLTAVASSVDYSVAPNTAVTPGDYTAGTSALTGTLNFAAGVTTQTITLNITDDSVYELTENFNVNLTQRGAGDDLRRPGYRHDHGQRRSAVLLDQRCDGGRE